MNLPDEDEVKRGGSELRARSCRQDAPAAVPRGLKARRMLTFRRLGGVVCSRAQRKKKKQGQQRKDEARKLKRKEERRKTGLTLREDDLQLIHSAVPRGLHTASDGPTSESEPER